MKKTLGLLAICCAFVLSGLLLSRPALAQIAPGVQQSAQTATINGTVSLIDGTLVSGAEVKLVGPALLSTTSDAHGGFQFTQVPHGIYTIVASAGNLGTTTKSNIAVNGDITVQVQYAKTSTELRTIANVTTKAAGAHINVTAASIDSVNPSDFAFQGNASWQKLLEGVPGVSVSGGIRGGSSCAVAVVGNPLAPTMISINGALPYETSTTLDGMPMYNFAPANDLFYAATPGSGTDISFLPLPAFQSADIVRGPGANAPSIVSSIGGSFVLHAPGAIDHNGIEMSFSNDPYGGIVSNFKGQYKLGKLSTMFTYGVNDSPGPVGTKMEYANDLFAGSIVSINGNPVVNTGTINYQVAVPTYGTNCQNCLTQNNFVFCCVKYSTAWSSHSTALSMSYDFSRALSAQVFYASSSHVMPDLPSPSRRTLFTPDSGYTGSLTPGLYAFQDATEEGPLHSAEQMLEEKITAYVGPGILRLAAMQNNSYFNISFPYVWGPNPGTYTAYGTAYYASAPNTPVNFNGTSANFVLGCPFSVTDDYSISHNRDLLASYAVQLGSRVNAGVSWVKTYYNAPYVINEIYFGSPLNYVQIPDGASQTSNEFRFNLGFQPTDRLAFDASIYSAKATYHVVNPAMPNGWVDVPFPYSAPRFSGTYHMSRDVSVRASVGGGYALPPLSYLTGTNGVPSCYQGSCSETLTNLNITPEKAFSLDIGADARIHGNTTISLDLYRNNLFGQFFQSTTSAGSCPTCAGQPLYITEYENLTRSVFQGINLEVRHEVARGVYWHGGLGLTRAYVVSVPPGFYNGIAYLPPSYAPTVCTNCANTYIVPGINFSGGADSASAGGAVPYANGSAAIGYRWSPDAYVDISSTYFGNNNAYFEPAFLSADLNGSIPITTNVSLGLTLRNITNIYGASTQTYIPAYLAPAAAGTNPYTVPWPQPLWALPIGPRSLIVTLHFKS